MPVFERIFPFVFAFAVAHPSAAAAPGAGGLPAHDLLFSSTRDGNAEVYVQRAGSTEWTNLTNHPEGDNWPVWSPDGRRIAFQSRRGGNLDVWTMAADGASPARLTDDPEPDYLPAWSPDGRRIVFTSWRREPGDTARAPHLYVMNADGSKQRRLVARTLGTSAGAAWSPDGRRLVYARKAGENGADLWITDGDGRNERRLTTGGEVYHGSPVFSPDGREIAYYADDGVRSAIEAVRPDGSGRRVILAAGKNWYPRWSPDGRWLVCTVAADTLDRSNIDLIAIPASGEGAAVGLAPSPKREAEGSWRPAPRAGAR